MSVQRYKEGVTYHTDWYFFVHEGAELTASEKKSVLSGSDIGRECTVYKHHNIIPTIARQTMLETLAGIPVSLAETTISHQELGTGTTAPANTDTDLETPSVGTKKALSSISVSSNVLNITSFWAAGEATGTWREFGTFINSTVLFNRVAINIAISAAQSLTIDGTITLT